VDLAPIVSLGEMPLANSYLRPEDLAKPEPRYPLDLVHCRACQLVQITCTVPPEILFRDYLYLSSTSTTMVAHARELAQRLVAERGLGGSSLAMEVASNDGYLLQHYVAAGVPVLGVEPARNVAEIATAKGVRTVAEFFNAELAAKLRAEHGAADVIHANNVLAHVADLNGFVEGFRVMLADGGVVVSESPYLGSFLEHVEFDTIYHEHLCYYSLTALVSLFGRHKLVIEDYEALAIHGGTMRIFARHEAVARPTARVAARLEEERSWGEARYAAFAAQIARVTGDVTALVRKLRAEGHRVCAYGAAAKGTVLLNACGLGAADLDFVCDGNSLKQGRLMPGVHVPIVPPALLLESNCDYCLLLVWNIADEILAKQAAWIARGGKFIIAVPSVKVLP
jgi:SAM-dependent methyltransferase